MLPILVKVWKKDSVSYNYNNCSCALYIDPPIFPPAANYTISEGTTDSQRLYFGGASDSSVTRPLYLPAPDTPTCDNVTIYVLVSVVIK